MLTLSCHSKILCSYSFVARSFVLNMFKYPKYAGVCCCMELTMLKMLDSHFVVIQQDTKIKIIERVLVLSNNRRKKNCSLFIFFFFFNKDMYIF